MFRPSLMVASRELLARVPNIMPRDAKLPRDAFSGLLKSNSNVFIHGVAVRAEFFAIVFLFFKSTLPSCFTSVHSTGTLYIVLAVPLVLCTNTESK